jgi:uncharacterized protein YprB with RNaseH-like and TPR domain
MASTLKDRLDRIKELKKSEPKPQAQETCASSDNISAFTDNWITCGFKALKREVTLPAPFSVKTALPQALAIIVPDLALENLPSPKDFLFFDLETTGLSGGAGTTAFLAAFGKPLSNGKILITQYLLLDYPGENDFLEAVLKEFENENSVIVTYNGKCFDSQILKTRCLMNGIKPPQYFHADLLYPARRLWKNVIHDCSQSSIETKILGLDRSGDIPGSFAPEIWFEFLKTGRTDRLMAICGHNCADITGLASILGAMICAAADPFGAGFSYDIDRIALYWRDFNRRHNSKNLQITGNKLLRFAAESKCRYLPNKKAAVFRALAIDSERKLKDVSLAIKYVKKGLELKEAGQFWKNEFEHRLKRLERKFSANC